jgi:hypothetical protein
VSVNCGPYVGAKTCTGIILPGVKGGMAWYLGAYKEEGAKNLGIYNCRSVRGGSTTSLHGEARAGDWGTPVENNWSWNLAELLRMNSAELGLQGIIHRRKIWSSSRCSEGWRPYGGVAAHFDHFHNEWTWAAARRSEAETIALFNRILGDPSPIRDGLIIPAPQPAPASLPKIPVAVQAKLNALGFIAGEADGKKGPMTEKALKAFQFAAGISVDGDYGPQTQGALDKVPNYLGENARAFQQRLKDRGWKISVDGDWGPQSAKILTAFQQEKGLGVDGKMGPQSWTALWTRGV